MTFEQKIRQLLSEHGLWTKQKVDEVIERAKADLKPMDQKWNDATDGYPPQLLAALWLNVKRIALEYIDEVIPQAFYRNMFVE